MQDLKTPNAEVRRFVSKDELSFLEILIVLAKNKKRIIKVPLIVAVASAALSFALPNVYRATTTLLPPQQAQSSAAALLSQLGSVAGLAAGAAGLKNPNDLYVGMLQSRIVADRLIDRFELKKVYDLDLSEKARKKLEDDTVITAGKDGLISIEVESKDQQLVAKLANGYVEELQKLTKVLAVTDAAQRRLFYEQQLEIAKNNLAKAESKLKGTLETRGVISVDSQSRAIVETSGRLRAQISAKQIELNSMRAFVTPNNPDFKKTEEELKSLQAELSKFEGGRAQDELRQTKGDDKAGLENIQILRDVKYYQMLYELLAKQYEVSRLDEANNAAIIQVLDPAIEPERRYKPKRALIVALSTVLALIIAVIWAFVAEARDRLVRIPGGAARWDEFKSYFGRRKNG